jgi:hypothetical protein
LQNQTEFPPLGATPKLPTAEQRPEVVILEKPNLHDEPKRNNEPKLEAQRSEARRNPNLAHQDPGYQAFLSGYKQNPLMPYAPTFKDMVATFNLVAQVRVTNPHLAEFLLIHMDLAHQAVFNPMVHEFLTSHPNVGCAMILNPRLAYLLWTHPELVEVARVDVMLNIIAKVDCFLFEHLLENPAEADVLRKNWLEAVQYPHFDLYEEAKRTCTHACTCKGGDPDLDDILSDVDLDDLDLGLEA